jgi:hypothetical protein
LTITINGRLGTIQEGDAQLGTLPFITAASGIVQFEIPRVANFPDQTASLIDHGDATIEGKTFHRITVESPLRSKAMAENTETLATDLYFDSASHLLIKSANLIRIEGSGNNEFLRVITYEDYRQVDSSMVPFRYTQTLNGQKQWTLQLSEVQLNPDLPGSLFEF